MGSNTTSFPVLENPAPSFTTSEASEFAKFWFKETLDVSPLVSERDQNFLLTNKNADNNYILFRNIFYKPIIENFDFYIVDTHQKKILHKQKIKSNFSNLVEIKKEFINKKTTIRTLMMMKEIVKYLPNECLQMDPIQACEYMAENNDIFYCPYIYGFSNYSRLGYRKTILTFSNVMDLEGNGPVGTHLGGTGIAVSKKSSYKKEAFEYAFWVASSKCQKGIFYENGGQPGNAIAWEDQKINAETNNFFKNTRDTLEGAWVRPRHNGYMKFQDMSGDIINDFLKNNLKEQDIYDKLNYEFKKSFV